MIKDDNEFEKQVQGKNEIRDWRFEAGKNEKKGGQELPAL
jgi:hypothetical protein